VVGDELGNFGSEKAEVKNLKMAQVERFGFFYAKKAVASLDF
jgi:hypothetical protein